jgi:glycosyltransferase involved in cell wall biosynthesis
LGIPREKVRVIYKGVDLYLFKPLNKVKKNGEYSSIKILYVGQLNKEKGLDDLICAFIKLYKEFPQLELLLAGSGPYEKVINKVIDKYPIKLLGFVSYNELPGIYRQADIFCSPSKSVNFLGIKIWEELFSYTLMEAQASGLPIIATRCGGIPEEIAKENLLVDQGDTRALYSCLKEFIQSPEKGIKIGKINRERAESFFDLQKQAEATEEAILSIL